MENTLWHTMTWPGLSAQVKSKCARCPICQKYKKLHKKYGLLSPKQAEFWPWEAVCVATWWNAAQPATLTPSSEAGVYGATRGSIAGLNLRSSPALEIQR